MAEAPIFRLPDEMLLNICRLVRYYPDDFTRRSIEWTSTHDENDDGPGPTLWDLCFVSRRFNELASTVLYEKIDDNQAAKTQMFHMLVHPQNAKLVRHFICDRHSTSYRDFSCGFYWLSEEDAMREVKALADRCGLTDAYTIHPRTKKLRIDNGAEPLISVMALPNLRKLEITLDTFDDDENAVVENFNPPQLFQLFDLTSPLHAHIPNRLKDLTLKAFDCWRGNGKNTANINRAAPIFRIESLRSLTLSGWASAPGSTITLQDALDSLQDALKDTPFPENKLRRLALVDCRLTKDDLTTIGHMTRLLDTFIWKYKRANEMPWHDDLAEILQFATLNSTDIVEAFRPCAANLKSLKFQHMEGPGKPSEAALGRWAEYGELTLEEQAEIIINKICGGVDFSDFAVLETLEASATALHGPLTEKLDFNLSACALPRGLRQLRIRLPHHLVDLHTSRYGSKIWSEEVPVHSRYFMALCAEVSVLGRNLENLDVVKIRLDKTSKVWKLLPEEPWKLVRAMRAVRSTELIVAGRPGWGFNPSRSAEEILTEWYELPQPLADEW